MLDIGLDLKVVYNYLLNADYDLMYRKKTIADIGMRPDQLNIFDCSQNRESVMHFRDLNNTLELTGLPYLILTSDPNCSWGKLSYYPCCLKIVSNASDFNIDIERARIYKFCCLNRNAHAHRIWLYFNLLISLDSCLTTFHNQPGDPYELNDLDPKLVELASQLPSTEPTGTHFNNLHAAYSTAYVDIVTETMMRDNVFISEKTWKPIASGQLFLIAGGVGTIAYLRQQGIDVFDDIIDHGYDNPGSWLDRITKFANSVKKLENLDLDSIWKNTLHRRQANRDLVASRVIDKTYTDQIEEKINFYYPDIPTK